MFGAVQDAGVAGMAERGPGQRIAGVLAVQDPHDAVRGRGPGERVPLADLDRTGAEIAQGQHIGLRQRRRGISEQQASAVGAEGGRGRLDRAVAGQLNRVGLERFVERTQPELGLAGAGRYVGDRAAIRRPGRVVIAARVSGEVMAFAALDVEQPDVELIVAILFEDEPLIVRAPGRSAFELGSARQLARLARVEVEQLQVPAVLSSRGIGDLATVMADGGLAIFPGPAGEASRRLIANGVAPQVDGCARAHREHDEPAEDVLVRHRGFAAWIDERHHGDGRQRFGRRAGAGRRRREGGQRREVDRRQQGGGWHSRHRITQRRAEREAQPDEQAGIGSDQASDPGQVALLYRKAQTRVALRRFRSRLWDRLFLPGFGLTIKTHVGQTLCPVAS